MHRRVMCSNNGQAGSEPPEADCHRTWAERRLSLHILACHSVCVCLPCVCQRSAQETHSYTQTHNQCYFLVIVVLTSPVLVSRSQLWRRFCCRSLAAFILAALLPPNDSFTLLLVLLMQLILISPSNYEYEYFKSKHFQCFKMYF